MSGHRPQRRQEVLLQLTDPTELTQYGTSTPSGASNFHHALRDHETEMSLILGRQSAETAELLVRKVATGGAQARYTTAKHLRDAGFRVAHTPTQANKLHVSVYFDGPWTPDVASTFDECFTQ